MTRPTVVILCVHGETKPHRFVVDAYPYTWRDKGCPGGRVLEQAIIIERDKGDWSAWAVDTVMGMTFDQDWSILVPEGVNPLVWSEKILDALASAQEET